MSTWVLTRNELLIAAIVILLVVGTLIWSKSKEHFGSTSTYYQGMLPQGSLRYLDIYEDQDQYQRRPSIWPVVDTATTARFAGMREAIHRAKGIIPSTARDAVLDMYYLAPGEGRNTYEKQDERRVLNIGE